MKYRKKPVVIEAIRVMGDEMYLINVRRSEDGQLEVYDRLHDTYVKFEAGDWIITGVQGETYPCKADVFEATYEPAE